MKWIEESHRTYQGKPHSDCKCEACNYWYPVVFELTAQVRERDDLISRAQEIMQAIIDSAED